jgi:hypothetical protein
LAQFSAEWAFDRNGLEGKLKHPSWNIAATPLAANDKLLASSVREQEGHEVQYSEEKNEMSRGVSSVQPNTHSSRSKDV